MINKNEIPFLLRNDGGNANNWLVLRTEGVKSNRSGIGARVQVTAGGMRRIFEVRASDSYLSSNDIRVHIGLGVLKQADVEIRWPSGQIESFFPKYVPISFIWLEKAARLCLIRSYLPSILDVIEESGA